MLRSSNWLGHSPFTGKLTGSSPVRSTDNYIAGYGSGLSARSHKPGIGGSNPSPAHWDFLSHITTRSLSFFPGPKNEKGRFPGVNVITEVRNLEEKGYGV